VSHVLQCLCLIPLWLIWCVFCFQRSDKHLPLNTLQMHGPTRRLCCARPRSVHVIFRVPLASFTASGASFERWLWAPPDFFRLIVYIPAFYVSSGAFELRLIIFSCFFVEICFSFMNSLFGLPNTVSPKSHYCAWGRAIQRPRTRYAAARQVSNAHERDLVTNNNVYFRPFQFKTYLLNSCFSDPVRGQPAISASGDWRILCRVKKQ